MNRTHRTGMARMAVGGATVMAASIAAVQTVTLAQEQPPRRGVVDRQNEQIWHDDGSYTINGNHFPSRAAYFESEYFRLNGMRCATVVDMFDDGGLAGGSTNDCTNTSTAPYNAAIYAPAGVKFRIPTVFHNIRDSGGSTGNLTDAQILANMVVLNEDFRALVGTPGAPGQNTEIEFFLTDDFATALGGGTTTPGSGIMRYNNTTWYNDSGSYFNTIARTPTSYMNLYSNSAGGALGYVPFLGTNSTGVGTSSDRVVIAWDAVGDPCPVGGIYCTGRTATHEVGHYLGLHHTFNGGCGTITVPGCYTSADRLCDTNATSSSNFGCPTTQNTCGDGLDNVRNYMDYTNDTCMNNFTNEQARRMRCVLDNRRISLPIIVNIFPGNFTGTPNTLNAAINTPGTTLADNRTQTGRSDGAGDIAGSYTGNPWQQLGDEVAYRINHPGGDLMVKLTGLTADLDLNILGAAGTPASNIQSSFSGGLTRERVVIPGAAAGTYYAVVETFMTASQLNRVVVFGGNFNIRYSRCVADINDDNVVNVTDLLAIIGDWGACATTGGCDTDINLDSQINVTDLLAVIDAWGPCP